jgi:hypothetical protein
VTDTETAAESRNHRDEAVVALVDREFDRAADAYALAAYGTLAGLELETRGRDGHPLAPDERGWVGHALKYLLLSGAALRAAGAERRARRRCQQGVLIAADLRDEVVEHEVQRAALGEFVADLGVVGGFGEPSAYDGVRDRYEAATVDDPTAWVTTPLLEAAADGPMQAARNGPHAFQWDDLHGSSPEAYLVHRARFKRSRLPRVVEHVADAGVLHPPRGTTEHNNADYVCPNCGTNEVSWVADLVVCIDCSARMEPR